MADGFAILKVGPAATFALREAFYGLEAIASEIDGAPDSGGLRSTLERMMLLDPSHWQAHYRGTANELRLQRHFSYSDRIRYYWPHPDVTAAATRLLNRFAGRPIPATLIRQYLGSVAREVDSGRLGATPFDLLRGSVYRVLDDYAAACGDRAAPRAVPAPSTR